MSAERLRAAAALMRERAEAVDTSDAVGGADESIRFTWAEQIKFLIVDPDATHLSTFGHPAVALAVADWLDDIAARHKPSEDQLDLYLHYYSDEPCEQCEEGGHLSTVCEGCYPSWEGMDGHSIYPCREVKAALAVADAYLGDQS